MTDKWLWENMSPAEIADDFTNRLSEISDRSKWVTREESNRRAQTMLKERFGYDISI
jgi:hypothetical protein